MSGEGFPAGLGGASGAGDGPGGGVSGRKGGGKVGRYGAESKHVGAQLPLDVVGFVCSESRNMTRGLVRLLRSHPGYAVWAKSAGVEVLPVPEKGRLD